ncbi:MAG TPA: methyltransferase domain-containing protein [Gaiellaceae bacterium]|nr:methyltransferase domain-containing protein [Gaiellaceae bacterium]
MSEREKICEQYATNANLRARIALHDCYSRTPVSYPHWIFDGYSFGDEADVLEVGCGDGNIWRENLERIPPGWRLTLTDFSSGMVDAARAVLGDRAKYAVADAQDIPFPDESFDAVIANHMLFHIEDRPQALGEIARVLRPGGKFRATTIGRKHLHELRELVPPQPESQWARVRERFMIEQVADELAPFFVHVEIERVPGPEDLEVTDLEILLDFVRSRGDVEEEDLEPLRRAYEREFAERGFFTVSRASARVRADKP